MLVQNIQEEMRLEIGYSLLPHYEDKGFATEAAQACKAFGFKNNYDAHFTNDLISMIHVNNRPSVQVALNNKMKLQKIFQAAN